MEQTRDLFCTCHSGQKWKPVHSSLQDDAISVRRVHVVFICEFYIYEIKVPSLHVV